MRRSLVFETFPLQPHLGLSQINCSSPKIFIASISESVGSEHFRCKLILWPPLGQARTILYALLIPHSSTLWRIMPTLGCEKASIHLNLTLKEGILGDFDAFRGRSHSDPISPISLISSPGTPSYSHSGCLTPKSCRPAARSTECRTPGLRWVPRLRRFRLFPDWQ